MGLSRTFLILSFGIGGMAILIGTIGTIQPNLFLKIPKVGFIFWAITGHPIPPYFDSTPLKQDYFHQYVQNGDWIVASMPKAGTIWLHNIMYMLNNNGSDDFPKRSMFDHIGTTEMLAYPEHSVEKRIEETNAIRTLQQEQQGHSRLTHFTHLSPAIDGSTSHTYVYGLDVSLHPNIKYIVAIRNPKECIRSIYPFMNNHNPDFRAMWGGFPPPFSNKEEALDFSLQNKDFMFNPPVAWWKLRKEPNVLLVHFSNLKTDLRGEVLRIAKFVGVDVNVPIANTNDDESQQQQQQQQQQQASTTTTATTTTTTTTTATRTLLDVIVQKASFKYMKARQVATPGVYANNVGRPGEPKMIIVKDHIQNGTSGGAEEFFTTEMNVKFEQGILAELAAYPDLLEWLLHGGTY